jgi:iron complex transport system ATP-binding protein
MLRAENLHLAVPGRTLCRDLSVAMQPGQCWGVLGRNGCGKSTLLQVLSGLTKPAGGTAWLGERPLRAWPRRELAARLGVLLQEEDNGYIGSVQEYVATGRFPHISGMGGFGAEDATATAAALRQLRLEPLAQRPLHTLSGGERQRARIAMLLAQAPDVYCLDEPLLHLDINHQIEIMQLFRDLASLHGKTVVMVLHDPWWARRFCDHVLLMYDNGEVASGAGSALLTGERLESLYQCGMQQVLAERGMDFAPANDSGLPRQGGKQ